MVNHETKPCKGGAGFQRWSISLRSCCPIPRLPVEIGIGIGVDIAMELLEFRYRLRYRFRSRTHRSKLFLPPEDSSSESNLERGYC